MSNFVVEVKNLIVSFGEFKAVNNVSFSVKKGEIFGLLGANGAGKTTTIRVICGLLLASSGEVKVCNIKLQEGSENQVKSKVGYMSQKFTLYDDLTVDENFSFAAGLRNIKKKDFLARKDYLLNFIDFNYKTNVLISDLPQGVKQQVSLVASMLHNPEVIFLDEPTAGVSPAARGKFWDLIRKLTSTGTTVIVTTHYMDEAEYCERIALMRAGELIALENPNELKRKVFPSALYDLEPIENKINLSFLSKLKKDERLSFFESYGYHYHISPKEANLWKNLEEELKPYFIITNIKPSLEDVFIKLVEGQNR